MLMPLLDHFRPPLESRAPWSSICSFWVVAVARQLNRGLPKDRYRAFATTNLGSQVEADVSEFEFGDGPPVHERNGHGGLATVSSPTAVATFEPNVPDDFAVRINDLRDDMRLVGAIEFVSPANKDRERHRRQFLAKCVGYLDADVGLVMIDVVTNRTANLHNELMEVLAGPARTRLPDVPTYVAAYRSTHDVRQRIDTWPYAAAVGQPIPSVPLVLRNGPSVTLELEQPYIEALADHNL